MNKKRNRRIPNKISESVKRRHFFECAWCGLKLFERHHIYEFHAGGQHTEDNLILLCPNHHTMAHSGKISADELLERKSTHIKGDRLTGDFKTTVTDLKILMCGGSATNTPTLLSHNGYPILSIYKENENVLVDAKFYNKQGALVFWMSRSMYWSLTNSIISQPKVDYLEIKNTNSSIYLKIEKTNLGDGLIVEMATYLGGDLIRFDENYANLPRNNRVTGNVTNCKVFIEYGTKNKI